VLTTLRRPRGRSSSSISSLRLLAWPVCPAQARPSGHRRLVPRWLWRRLCHGHTGHAARSTSRENRRPSPAITNLSLLIRGTEKGTDVLRQAARTAAEGGQDGWMARAHASAPAPHCLQSHRQNVPCFNSAPESWFDTYPRKLAGLTRGGG